MRKSCALPAISLLLILFPVLTYGQTNVLTWHYNNWRTGANTTETVLTTTNVTATQFGKICSAPTDGDLNGAPLIVTNVPFTVKGTTTTHDVAYVVTENDSVYAFDANTCALLNSVSMVPVIAGCTPVTTCEQPVSCLSIGGGGCQTIAPTIGIISTPVIDATVGANGTTGTIYLIAETQIGAGKSPSAWIHRVHGLDITTLNEQPGSPVQVAGSYASVTFKSGWQIQRSSLLLLKNAGPNGDTMLYAGFSLMDGAPKKLGEKPPGWVFGWDTTNLSSQPTGLPYVFTTTPNGTGPYGPGGGVWQAGAGLSAGLGSATDPNTYIYFGTGDGTWDAGTGGEDYADSFMKLNTNLSVASYFTRADELKYKSMNIDYGSGGMVLVPDNTFSNFPYISLNSGKDGNVYVVDRGNPGGYNGVSNTNLQTVPGKFAFLSTSAYWNGFLYDAIVGGALKSWALTNTCNAAGPVCTTGGHLSKVIFDYGVSPSVSSNGTTKGTGIVWAIETYDQETGGNPAILYAFNALNMTELYDSTQCGSLDTPGLAVKFTVPSVANGKVYIGTQGEMDVFGPVATRTCTAAAPKITKRVARPTIMDDDR